MLPAYRHLILCQGRYQLLGLSNHAHFAADDIVCYLVVSQAGDELRQEATFDRARAWIEQLQMHEASQPRLDALPGRATR